MSDSDDSIWDRMKYEPLDKTPDDADTVDFGKLKELEEKPPEDALDAQYSQFWYDIYHFFLEEHSQDEDTAVAEWEAKVPEYKAGRTFFEERYLDVDDYDIEEALDEFFLFYERLQSVHDAHKRLLEEQESASETLTELKSPREAFTLRGIDFPETDE